MIDAGIRIDASIDEDRYTDLLTLASWSKTVRELESVLMSGLCMKARSADLKNVGSYAWFWAMQTPMFGWR